MADSTKIEWANHTFNAWEGCEKVSPGCKNCYAAARDKHWHRGKHWGKGAPRLLHTDSYWRKPIAWNLEAQKAGRRAKVFCSSLSDLFEDRPELAEHRARLFALTRATPHLDWQLLTKRPENARRLWQIAALSSHGCGPGEPPIWAPNVWLGTTAEDQKRADERIPHLLRIPAAVRFLSIEPMLEHIELLLRNDPATCSTCGGTGRITDKNHPMHPDNTGDGDGMDWCIDCDEDRAELRDGISWVIVGGESGPSARPFDLAWARSIVAQCVGAGVPVFFKQAGAKPIESGVALTLADRKGGDLAELPADLRVRQFPEVAR